MRKALLLASVAVMAVSAATTASAGGNGAERSGLSPQAGSSTDQCVEGSGAGSNGFAIVNAPGKPGDARFVNGEVSLKDGTPNTVYVVSLSTDGGDCMPVGMITTNGQGNGNYHLNSATTGGGSFYVVLSEGGAEAFASKTVTVN